MLVHPFKLVQYIIRCSEVALHLLQIFGHRVLDKVSSVCTTEKAVSELGRNPKCGHSWIWTRIWILDLIKEVAKKSIPFMMVFVGNVHFCWPYTTSASRLVSTKVLNKLRFEFDENYSTPGKPAANLQNSRNCTNSTHLIYQSLCFFIRFFDFVFEHHQEYIPPCKLRIPHFVVYIEIISDRKLQR